MCLHTEWHRGHKQKSKNVPRPNKLYRKQNKRDFYGLFRHKSNKLIKKYSFIYLEKYITYKKHIV